jgi:hypothetical protein
MQMQTTLSTEHMVQCSGHALLRPNHSHSRLLYIYLSSQIPSGDYGPAAETTVPLVLSTSKLRQSDENTSLLCCSAKTTVQIKIELTIPICQFPRGLSKILWKSGNSTGIQGHNLRRLSISASRLLDIFFLVTSHKILDMCPKKRSREAEILSRLPGILWPGPMDVSHHQPSSVRG